MALCNSIKKLHAVDVAASTIYEEYLDVVRSYGAKDLIDRRIADYIWELDNTGLTISRISSKRYGKERVVRLGVPINIITRILGEMEGYLKGWKMVDCGALFMEKENNLLKQQSAI